MEQGAENKSRGPIRREFFDRLIHLGDGVDKLATIQEIKSKSFMSGPNAWMLICSIMIASIGLNMNSPAVIIGAMLISPLMSPILGMGLAVGINDQSLLKLCLKHFGVAVLIAVITSTIYFLLTPFKELTGEILARTAPTFLDVLIGFFGGIAGIVSIARKDISTTLPGVAIATALMPPLCVTGYGLASGEWGIASKSFYLFFLNTFFVSLATYFIIGILNFPHKTFVNPKERYKNIIGVAMFSIIAIIPSFFIFKSLFKDFKTKQNIESFISEYIGKDEIYLDEYTLIKTEDEEKLVLKVYGDAISDKKMAIYKEGLAKNNLGDIEINIIPTSEIDLDRMHLLESKVTGVEKIASQLEEAKKTENMNTEKIGLLKEEINNLQMDSLQFTRMCRELHVIFPQLEEVSLSYAQTFDFSQYKQKTPLLVLDWKSNADARTRKLGKNKIQELMNLREGFEELEIINQ